MKYYAPGSKKVKKAIFSIKVKVKVIDVGAIWMGIISAVWKPNMKSLSLMVKNLQWMLKLTTSKQTDRQDQNSMPNIIPSRGIKICIPYMVAAIHTMVQNYPRSTSGYVKCPDWLCCLSHDPGYHGMRRKGSHDNWRVGTSAGLCLDACVPL